VGRPSAPTAYGFSRATGPLLKWHEVEARLRDARNYWLATTRPDSRPHTTPLWGVWVHGALYVSGLPGARWAQNLAANPACSAHLESGDEVVILEGTAEDVVPDAETSQRIVAAWDVKYGRLHPDPANDGIMRLRPRTARAWTDPDTMSDATRWDWS
jgi:nitroimidazol reductase NimA-like FMN-containing flavoprotein (pyridoxamine 5'-phosphate oxidase superfamily)